MASSDYFRRRIAFRALAAVCMAVAAVGTMAIYEAVQRRSPAHEALLFPAVPETRESTSQPVLLAMLPALGFIPLLVPKTFPSRIVKLTIPLQTPNLEKAAFLATAISGDKVTVVKTRYVRDIREIHQGTSGKDIALMLMFDASDSISMNDPENLRIEAACGLIGKLPSSLRLSVGFFGAPGATPTSVTGTRIEIRPFSRRHQDSSTFVAGLENRTYGGTPLFDALDRGIEAFTNEWNAPRRLLICFADGEDNSSSVSVAEVAERAKQAGVILSFVTLGHSDWGNLKTLAKETGGKVVQADNASDLAVAFDGIAQTLVRTEDRSYYEVTLKLQRQGQAIPKDERIPVTIEADGKSFIVPAGGTK